MPRSRPRPAPGQMALYGSQSVHLGRPSRVTGITVCAMCKVSLSLVAASACCDRCPGWVEPAPPRAVLPGSDGTAALETLEAAA